MSNTLIELKNSNPLIKYPVDATQLNHNFNVLLDQQGVPALKDFIESSGQVYTEVLPEQLSIAVAQYVLSSSMFRDVGSGDTIVLQPQEGFGAPYKYTYGMVVQFIPNRSNTGPTTVQIGQLPSYPILVNELSLPAGYILSGKITSLQFMGTYWTFASTAQSSSGSTSGGGDAIYAFYADGFIKTAVLSAGITYDTSKTEQLAQAISTYVANSCYSAEFSAGTYNLTPALTTAKTPIEYKDNMVVSFVVPETNSVFGVSVALPGLIPIPLCDVLGNPIAENTLVSGEILTLIYKSGSFRILTGYLNRLTLNNGYTVTGISNDPSMVDGSEKSLITEYAVKAYVNSKVSGAKYNSIVSGYADANGTASALNAITDHAIQLKSSTTGSCYVESTPNDQANIIASSNTTTLYMSVDKLDETYWETEKTGFAVDNIYRIVSGDQGNRYVDVSRNSEGAVVYINTPPQPEWYGFKNLPKLNSYLRIKFYDQNSTPDSIQFEVNTSPTLDSSLWSVMAEEKFAPTTPEGDPEPYISYDYGQLSNMQTDASGYYTIEIPKTIISGDELVQFNPSGAFALRMVVTRFENQFPTTEELNSPGYNPNQDRTSEQYPVRIVDAILCDVLNDVPEVKLSYPSGESENISSVLYFSQYILDADDPTVSNLTSYENGDYAIYKVFGVDSLRAVPYALVYYKTTKPSPSADIEGAIYFDLNSYPYNTYVCVGDESGVYTWEKQVVMVLGTFKIQGNKISDVKTLSYGSTIIKDYDSITNPQTITINHMFGFPVKTLCQLICKTSNNGYAVGDTVDLYPFTNTTYSLSGDVDTGYTLNSDTSFLTVCNDTMTATIKFKNISIVNKNNTQVVSLPTNSWGIRIQINKD